MWQRSDHIFGNANGLCLYARLCFSDLYYVNHLFSFKVFTSRGLFIRSDIQDQGDVFIVSRCSERHNCSIDVVVPIYHQFLAK